MPPKKLNNKALEKIIENLDDLSENDSEDDFFYGDSVISPSSSYLHQNEEDRIEMKLEMMFGIDNMSDREEKAQEATVTLQTRESLQDILGSDCITTEEAACSTPMATDDIYDEQSGDQNAIPLLPLLQEIICEHDEQPLDSIQVHSAGEEDYQTTQNSVMHRDRSKPREWKMSKTTHDIPSFDKGLQPKEKYNHKTQPITIFEKFFPEYLIQLIVAQTNRYAIYKNSKDWVPVTDDGIRAYLGILIMMGLNPLPDMELYWSSDSFYNNSEISRVFPIKKFKKITKNLHLNDNTMEPSRDSPDYDKLYKLRPLITTLNEVYQEEAYNSSIQSIDECMVKFKGRCSLKQYMPKKPIKRGFKVWARCDAKTGYLYQFEIYTGKGDNIENEGLGYNVVMKLCNSLPINQGLIWLPIFRI